MGKNRTPQVVNRMGQRFTKTQDIRLQKIGITFYGCGKDEEGVFRKFAQSFGVEPTIARASVLEYEATPICGNRCISVDHKCRISKSNLVGLHKAGVKYISTRSIGYDHIDIEAAQELGITVGNIEYSPDSVADYTLMLILMAIRGAKTTMSRGAKQDFRLNSFRGKELRDMTVGVVGTGHIGNAVIQRLRGFGCRILTCNRSREANCAPLDELLSKSDIVTLHAPLNSDTYHMIGSKQLEIMKQGAFLVNTSRGALVDTSELIKTLESGKLAGAALDVLEGEEGIFYFDCSQKSIDNPFLQKLQKMPNVIITPHTAYYTNHALYDTVKKTILNCLSFERSQSYE